jgi:hypothetical protein
LTNSRNKGAQAEREVARLVLDHLGVRMVRNLDQYRSGGWDLKVDNGQSGPVAERLSDWCIEIKHHRRISDGDLSAFWTQALSQAVSEAKLACLWFREDRRSWRVLLPLSAIYDATPWGQDDVRGTICVLPETFFAIVRESA